MVYGTPLQDGNGAQSFRPDSSLHSLLSAHHAGGLQPQFQSKSERRRSHLPAGDVHRHLFRRPFLADKQLAPRSRDGGADAASGGHGTDQWWMECSFASGRRKMAGGLRCHQSQDDGRVPAPAHQRQADGHRRRPEGRSYTRLNGHETLRTARRGGRTHQVRW